MNNIREDVEVEETYASQIKKQSTPELRKLGIKYSLLSILAVGSVLGISNAYEKNYKAMSSFLGDSIVLGALAGSYGIIRRRE